MSLYLALSLFFAVAFVAILSIAIEKNTIRKQLHHEAYSNESLSVQKDFLKSLWDLKNFSNFTYLEKPRESKETHLRCLIRNLCRSTAYIKMISYSLSQMDQLLFFKIYAIEADEVGYDCFYKDLEIGTWFFQDQRKNPSIYRLATQYESDILEEVLLLLPKDQTKHVIEF